MGCRQRDHVEKTAFSPAVVTGDSSRARVTQNPSRAPTTMVHFDFFLLKLSRAFIDSFIVEKKG